MEAGMKEGKVVVYFSAGARQRIIIGQAFEKRHGIVVEGIGAPGSAFAERILAERRAGIYQADVIIPGSTTTITQLKPAGAVDPLEPVIILPEVLNPKVWCDGGLRWLDADRKVLAISIFASTTLVINTTLVKPDEIKSWRDLLNPKWKGKIVWNDPTRPGSPSKWAGVMGDRLLGWDYVKDFAKQQPIILKDKRQAIEWVAHGKYPIVLNPNPSILIDFSEAGASLQYVLPVEGGYLTSGYGALSLINRAPHPNAAKVFINWMLTKEGQSAFAKGTGQPASRLDASTEGVWSNLIPVPGKKYVVSDDEEFVKRQPEHMRLAKEIFAELVK